MKLMRILTLLFLVSVISACGGASSDNGLGDTDNGDGGVTRKGEPKGSNMFNQRREAIRDYSIEGLWLQEGVDRNAGRSTKFAVEINADNDLVTWAVECQGSNMTSYGRVQLDADVGQTLIDIRKTKSYTGVSRKNGRELACEARLRKGKLYFELADKDQMKISRNRNMRDSTTFEKIRDL